MKGSRFVTLVGSVGNFIRMGSGKGKVGGKGKGDQPFHVLLLAHFGVSLKCGYWRWF